MRSLAKLAVISAIGAAGACLALPALAAPSTWDHNGSRVTLDGDGTKRIISYAEPKAGLDKAGVKRGTVLFDGQVKKDGRVSGYAKIFKAGCDPVDYFVEGTIDGAKGEIVLQGQAPVYSGNDCKIKGYSEDSKDSTLVFRGRGGGTYAGNQPSAGGQPYEQGDGGYDARGQRDPRNDQGYADRGTQQQQPAYGQRDDAYANRGNGQDDDQQYDSRQNDSRQDGNGGYGSRDYADRGRNSDYDPRNDRPRNDGYADQQYDDGQAADGADEEYRTYRYRTYRRTYQRPYQPSWRDGAGR